MYTKEEPGSLSTWLRKPPWFQMKVFVLTMGLCLLGDSGAPPHVYTVFTEQMSADKFEKTTLVAYIKYWAGRGLDYVFLQDSTFQVNQKSVGGTQ